MTNVGDPMVERILALIRDRTGLRLAPSRLLEADASVRRAMGRAGYRDPGPYLDALQTGEVTLDGLVAELTVRETYFFRDAAHFSFVRGRVLPDVLARRGHEHALRAWSAGCASGEEAYSLAIVLEDERRPAVVLATDIAREALCAAREGVYSRWSLRALDDTQIARWFRRVAADRWRLDDSARRCVSFEVHNLLKHAYPLLPAGIWGMDVIFCRNVLMYFDAAALEHVARGLHDSLANGGWLITGPSDPSLDGLGSLRAVITEAGVFYQRATIEAVRPRRTSTESTEPAPAQPCPAPSFATSATPPDPLDVAHEAFAIGDYDRVLALLRNARDEASALLYVRATANLGRSEEALHETQTRTRTHPLSTNLQFLEAVLLMTAGRLEDATRTLRRVLYLDPSSVIAHFVLGTVLRSQGRLDEARRAYRNARDLARSFPADAVLDLGEGERAGDLVEVADAELAMMQECGG
jgi:chemotaxis protein methyltransferase CheR